MSGEYRDPVFWVEHRVLARARPSSGSRIRRSSRELAFGRWTRRRCLASGAAQRSPTNKSFLCHECVSNASSVLGSFAGLEPRTTAVARDLKVVLCDDCAKVHAGRAHVMLAMHGSCRSSGRARAGISPSRRR